MVKLPLPDPPEGDTVSQDGELLLTVHGTFEVTVTPVLDASSVGFQVEADRVSDDDTSAWSTETVRVWPPPVTVTVPLLVATLVFAAA